MPQEDDQDDHTPSGLLDDDLDPEAQRDAALVDAIREAGGSSEVAVRVSHALPGKGRTYLGTLRLPLEEVGDWKERVVERYGGSEPGSFHAEFRTNGRIRGAHTFAARGALLPVTVDAHLPQATIPLPLAPASSPQDLREQIRRELAEEEAKKKAERDALVGPLEAKISELQRSLTPAPPPPSDYDRAEKLLELIEAKRGARGPSPEVLELKKTVERLEQEKRDQDKQAREAFEKEMRERLTSLTERKPKKRRKNPMVEMAESLMAVTSVDKMFSTLSKRADDSDSDFLTNALEEFKEPFESVVRNLARKFGKHAAASFKAGKKANGIEVPASFVKWVEAVFEKQALVSDVEWIRACLAQEYRPQVEAFARVTDETSLIQTVSQTLGEAVAQGMSESWKPEQKKGLVSLCKTLQKTIEEAKKPPEPDEDAEDTEDDADEESPE